MHYPLETSQQFHRLYHLEAPLLARNDVAALKTLTSQEIATSTQITFLSHTNSHLIHYVCFNLSSKKLHLCAGVASEHTWFSVPSDSLLIFFDEERRLKWRNIGVISIWLRTLNPYLYSVIHREGWRYEEEPFRIFGTSWNPRTSSEIQDSSFDVFRRFEIK